MSYAPTTQPACIRDKFWTETSWGWQTYYNGNMFKFSQQRFQAQYAPIKYRGEWIEIDEFKQIISKF